MDDLLSVAPQSIAVAEVPVEPDGPVDPEHILLLGQEDPTTLLRWIYQNLGKSPDEPLDMDWVRALYRGAMGSSEEGIDLEFSYCLQLQRYPVDIETFLFGDKYLKVNRETIYPEVLLELIKINNPDGQRVVNPYTEGVFTGGIGSAKSTTALYTVAYQLYVTSCFDSPHNTFGLDPSSEILFVFLGMAGDTAQSDYLRFYSLITNSDYFKHVFPFDKRMKSKLRFPHRIEVVQGIDTIGQNVMGGLIDEVNFGARVKDSKKAVDGGTYDATLTTYNGLARRRKSRFLSNGASPGILCLVSSKRYPGEFTDVKIAEAKSDPSIYIYDKRVWDVKPPGTFSATKFQVFVGDVSRKACIIRPGELYGPQDAHLIVEVPMDFLKEFQDDMTGALRDIAGVSTLARYPYIYNTNALGAAFGKRQSILNVEETDMETVPLTFYPKLFKDLEFDRWVHIDLGVTSDAAGIACGYVPKFIDAGEGAGPMPLIKIDFILRVVPPKNGEILFHKIRKLLTFLRDAGLPIKWVSFDSFQSVDSIQILRQLGFVTGRVSMDTTVLPYDVTKSALYTQRIQAPAHATCLRELSSLEKDSKTGKIDHPAKGSKDCSDALAGVVYGLSTRREVWSNHNVEFSTVLQASKEVEVKAQYERDGVDWRPLSKEGRTEPQKPETRPRPVNRR